MEFIGLNWKILTVNLLCSNFLAFSRQKSNGICWGCRSLFCHHRSCTKCLDITSPNLRWVSMDRSYSSTAVTLSSLNRSFVCIYHFWCEPTTLELFYVQTIWCPDEAPHRPKSDKIHEKQKLKKQNKWATGESHQNLFCDSNCILAILTSTTE